MQLTRLTFPYILLVSLVSLLGGVLNSLYRFAAVAATPILLNLCLIGALLGLSHWTETPGHALALGVTVGGIVQFVWLVVAARRAGMALRLRLPRLSAGGEAPARPRRRRRRSAPASPRSTWSSTSSPRRCCPRARSPSSTTPTA